MYPNPTKGVLNIKLNNNNNEANLEIHNLLGQQILKTKLKANNNKIPLKTIAKGLYLATIKTKNSTASKKLIIN